MQPAIDPAPTLRALLVWLAPARSTARLLAFGALVFALLYAYPVIAAASASPCGSLAPDADWRAVEGSLATIAYARPDLAGAALEASESLDAAATELRNDFGTSARKYSICIVGHRREISGGSMANADGTAGAALGAAGTAVIAADARETPRLALHEIAHLMAADRAMKEGERPLPEWLGEGIAEVASRPREAIRSRAAELDERGELPDLRWLESHSPRVLEGSDALRYYAAAGSAALTLVDARGWDGVWAMLRISGKLPADLGTGALPPEPASGTGGSGSRAAIDLEGARATTNTNTNGRGAFPALMALAIAVTAIAALAARRRSRRSPALGGDGDGGDARAVAEPDVRAGGRSDHEGRAA